MNAIPPLDPAAEARKGRHLRQLEELAELGMAMARSVAKSALHPPPADDTAADDTAPPDPETPATAPPQPASRSNPGLVFARLAHSVRQTIALEARIAAGGETPRRTPPPPPDPRRAVLQRAFRDAAGSGPNGAPGTSFRREVDERIEDELAADPGGHLPLYDILAAICDDLGITLDHSRLPDEVLDFSEIEPDPDAETDPDLPPPASTSPDTPDPPAAQAARPRGPDPP
ncbi:MAG TPA: hypothetical protein VHY76_02420 [Acetobacteraceae bacterium]|nr:hypothetical protein [Acetobacteraceae bacterium]